MSTEPSDQHDRHGRITRQFLLEIVGDLSERDAVRSERIEPGQLAGFDFDGNEAFRIAALDVLRDGLAEIAVDAVIAAAEGAAVMRRQRLDAK